MSVLEQYYDQPAFEASKEYPSATILDAVRVFQRTLKETKGPIAVEFSGAAEQTVEVKSAEELREILTGARKIGEFDKVRWQGSPNYGIRSPR